MWKSTKELELKLLVQPSFKLPDLTAVRGVQSVQQLPPQRLTATYHDTPDLRLLSHGMTLRYRTGENAPTWTLKLPAGNDIAARNELEYRGKAGTVPIPASELLVAARADLPLSAIASIRTRRQRLSVVDSGGEPLAEIADDRVSVVQNGKVAGRFREIEIEARNGDRRLLERIATALQQSGATPDQRSKLARALEGTAGPRRQDGPRSTTGSRAATQRVLKADLERLIVHDPYARMMDPEGIHQVRVAARRIRSLLREFGPALAPDDPTEIIEGLRRIGRILGDVRDLDILAARLQAAVGDRAESLAPALKSISVRHARARNRLRAGLSDPRYLGTLKLIEDLIDRPPGAEDAPAPRLNSLARRCFRRFTSAAGALTAESEDSAFHQVRIRAKRARYVAEALASLTKSRRKRDLQSFAAVAEQVQNVLGDYRDALFMRDALADISSRFPERGPLDFELGRLAERADRQAAQLRTEFLDAWPRLSRRRLPSAWRS